MIKSFIEIIENIADREKEILNESDETHPGIIGQMYEGLTAELVKKLSVDIFSDLGLKVSKGVVVDSDGTESGQIDCMLVVGDGEQIPYTDNYRYDVNDVVAVFEVKKTINKTEMRKSMTHLRKICDLVPSKSFQANLFERAFLAVVGEPARKLEVVHKEKQDHKAVMHSFLALESVLPLRIAIGFNGFATESGFRSSFLDILGEHEGKKGGSPFSLPSLIISNNYSIVKLTGMPFSASELSKEWDLLASSSSSGIECLVELIWTRLNFYFGVPAEVFGDDLEVPVMMPLLRAFYREDKKGWEYSAIEMTEAKLKEARDYESEDWFPPEISDCERLYLACLSSNPGIHYKDKRLKRIALRYGTTAAKVFRSLNDKRIVYKRNGNVDYLTTELAIIFHPSGKSYALDMADTKASLWMQKYGVSK
ncbi:DUF6602 domain-containing protein [Halobacteriovorax sp. YZS-1-1]|uniref:DUF6602 domain-containing protein n=1 Tax=unclassified Halobacteriovorax TaxID=2639665 RepID=UPI00399BCD33